MNNIENIPRDIPLALPAPEWLLVILLIVSFVAHIFFVNLMVGGSLLTTFFQLLGLYQKKYDGLARIIAKTITVNKSLAVVLGVAPLLTINALYTVYFYTANSLTGFMWIMVIPLVTVAFLLTYLHKYTWDILEDNKPLHLSISIMANLLFLFIPLIFLSNITTMIYPEKWGDIKGFLGTLLLPGVFPRYFHFLLASLSVTPLFLIWLIQKNKFDLNTYLEAFKVEDVNKRLFSIALISTGTQFLVGPLLYFSLPAHGKSWSMNGVIFLGILFGVFAFYNLIKAVREKRDNSYAYFQKIAISLTVTILCMATGRHMYRDKSLAWHKKLVNQKTSSWMSRSTKAREESLNVVKEDNIKAPNGKKLFRRKCSSCHSPETVAVGPSLREIQNIYQGNPEGIVIWAQNPGKKRPDLMQMPSFGSLPEDDLKAIAQYMLDFKI